MIEVAPLGDPWVTRSCSHDEISTFIRHPETQPEGICWGKAPPHTPRPADALCRASQALKTGTNFCLLGVGGILWHVPQESRTVHLQWVNVWLSINRWLGGVTLRLWKGSKEEEMHSKKWHGGDGNSAGIHRLQGDYGPKKNHRETLNFTFLNGKIFSPISIQPLKKEHVTCL